MDRNKKLRIVLLAIALTTQGSTSWAQGHGSTTPPSNPPGHSPNPRTTQDGTTRSPTPAHRWEDLTDLPELPSSCSALGYSTPQETHRSVHLIRYKLCRDAFSAWRASLTEIFAPSLEALDPYSQLEQELRLLRERFLRQRAATRSSTPDSHLNPNQRRPFHIPRANTSPGSDPEEVENQFRRAVEQRLATTRITTRSASSLHQLSSDDFLETGNLTLCGWDAPLRRGPAAIFAPPLARPCGTLEEWRQLRRALAGGIGPTLGQMQDFFHRGLVKATSSSNSSPNHQGAFLEFDPRDLPMGAFNDLAVPTSGSPNLYDPSFWGQLWDTTGRFCSPYLAEPNGSTMAQLHRDTSITPPPTLFDFHQTAVREAQQHCSPTAIFDAYRARSLNSRLVADRLLAAFGPDPETPNQPSSVGSFCAFVGRTRHLDACQIHRWCSENRCNDFEVNTTVLAPLSPLGTCPRGPLDQLLEPDYFVPEPLSESEVEQYHLPGRNCFDTMAARSAGRARIERPVAQCIGTNGGIRLAVDNYPLEAQQTKASTRPTGAEQPAAPEARTSSLTVELTREGLPGIITQIGWSGMRWKRNGETRDLSWGYQFLTLGDIGLELSEESLTTHRSDVSLGSFLHDLNGSPYRRRILENARNFERTLRQVCRESVERHRTPPQRRRRDTHAETTETNTDLVESFEDGERTPLGTAHP